jgi:hypothetical protein
VAGSRSMAAAAYSEGGRADVDSGSTTMTKSLRKSMMAACSEASVEAAACSGAGDEAVASSEAGIEDGRWWRRRGNF